MKTIEYKIDNYEITEETNDYRIIEGLTYWEDASHFGSVWLTQAMYNTYGLDRCGACETIEEAYGEYDPEWMPERKFCCVIYIDHCSGVTPIGMRGLDSLERTPKPGHNDSPILGKTWVHPRLLKTRH